jgi:hypothetical protein
MGRHLMFFVAKRSSLKLKIRQIGFLFLLWSPIKVTALQHQPLNGGKTKKKSNQNMDEI